jgi:hypothetical protein
MSSRNTTPKQLTHRRLRQVGSCSGLAEFNPVSAVSLWGVDVAPDHVVAVVKQILGLFGCQVSSVADATAQSLFGDVLSLIGSAVAMYGYYPKDELVTK